MKTTVLRTFLIVLAGSICLQQVVTLVYSFFTSAKWAMKTMYKDEREMVLPQIIICNANKINVTLAEELGINDEYLGKLIEGTRLEFQWTKFSKKVNGVITLSDMVIQLVMGGSNFYLSGVIPLGGIAKYANLDLVELQLFGANLYEVYQKKVRINFLELVNRLAHKCNLSLIQCYTGNIPWSSCCRNSETVVTVKGVCTRLDTSPSRHQLTPGPGAGYLLLYELHTDSYSTSVVDMELDTGITVQLVYENNISTIVAVRPNSKASIKLTRIEDVISYPTVTDGSFFPAPCRESIDQQVYYNMKTCQSDCTQGQVYELCNCFLATYSNVSNICEPHQVMRCKVAKLEYDYYRTNREEQPLSMTVETRDKMNNAVLNYQRCWERCTESCDQTKIIASVTTSQFTSPEQIPKIIRFFHMYTNRNLSQSYLIRNFIYLDIYFDNFSTQQNIIYSVATLNQLISLIGGQLGLWIGASIISVINFVPRIWSSAARFCFGNSKRIEMEALNKMDNTPEFLV